MPCIDSRYPVPRPELAKSRSGDPVKPVMTFETPGTGLGLVALAQMPLDVRDPLVRQLHVVVDTLDGRVDQFFCVTLAVTTLVVQQRLLQCGETFVVTLGARRGIALATEQFTDSADDSQPEPFQAVDDQLPDGLIIHFHNP